MYANHLISIASLNSTANTESSTIIHTLKMRKLSLGRWSNLSKGVLLVSGEGKHQAQFCLGPKRGSQASAPLPLEGEEIGLS